MLNFEQFDVKISILREDMKADIYMHQLDWFEVKRKEHKVFKHFTLKKNI